MTTIRQQIAELIRSIYNQCEWATPEVIAGFVERCRFDHILGKPEPTIDDVREEARRVYGKDVGVFNDEGGVFVCQETPSDCQVITPTAAYPTEHLDRDHAPRVQRGPLNINKHEWWVPLVSHPTPLFTGPSRSTFIHMPRITKRGRDHCW